jgi:predicted AlkP superfamily phosphohydrolase/phosphomutase
MEVLIEFGKILLPASVVLYAVYLMVRSFIIKEIELKKLEVRSRSIETTLPARLQAYERITLFLERISPQNLLIRLSDPGYKARDFQKILLDEIRNEYNHNVSQQVYMSDEVWSQVRNAKEDLTMLINDAASKMTVDSNAVDLSKKIFEMALEKKLDPIGHAISELKKEIQQTF